MKFNYIRTIKEYEKALLLLEDSWRLALDLETKSKEKYKRLSESARLSPHTGEVSILTLKGDNTLPQVFDIVCLRAAGYDPAPLIQLLRSRDYLLGHNIKFDVQFLLGEFRVPFTNLRCTLQLAQLLSNATGSKFGLMRGHGLADLCRDLLSVHISGKGTLQRADWGIDVSQRNLENPMWAQMIAYAADDTQYLFPIHDLLVPTIRNPLPPTPLIKTQLEPGQPPGFGMSAVMDVEMAFIPTIVELEWNGLPVSREILTKIQTAVVEEKNRLAAELCEELREFGLKTVAVGLWGDEVPDHDSLKTLNNPTKMKKILSEKLGISLESTQTKTLERALFILDQFGKGNGEDIELISEEEEYSYRDLELVEDSLLRSGADLLSKYLRYKKYLKLESMDLRPYINQHTKAIHGKYSQLRSATGRIGGSKPNTMQISARTDVVVELEVDSECWGHDIFQSDSLLDEVELDDEWV